MTFPGSRLGSNKNLGYLCKVSLDAYGSVHIIISFVLMPKMAWESVRRTLSVYAVERNIQFSFRIMFP